MKFGRVDGDVDVPHAYANVWAREVLSDGSTRLVVAPSGQHMDCLLSLTDCLSEPFFILYVLVVPRGEALPGRYQSPSLTREEAHEFLQTFRGFLEGDGRAHLWVASVDPPNPPSGTLIYDRHDLIYAYGPADSYVQALTRMGLDQAEEVRIPSPHSHHYNSEFDADARRLHEHFDWLWSELRESDEG